MQTGLIQLQVFKKLLAGILSELEVVISTQTVVKTETMRRA
jgi:hypothetical protein